MTEIKKGSWVYGEGVNTGMPYKGHYIGSNKHTGVSCIRRKGFPDNSLIRVWTRTIKVLRKPKCEIVAKKPKMVRVKAWANMDEDSWCDIITAVNVLPKYFSGAYSVPCTILIDEKYLRRKP